MSHNSNKILWVSVVLALLCVAAAVSAQERKPPTPSQEHTHEEPRHLGSVSLDALPSRRLPDSARRAVPRSASDAAVLSKAVSASEVFVSDTLTYTLHLRNPSPGSRTYTLTDTIPVSTTYISGSAEGGLVYNDAARRLTWSGALDAALLTLEESPAPLGYISLASLAVPPLACSDVCDNASTTLTGIDFVYLGQSYTSMGISSNGYIVPGTDTTNAFTFTNQVMPDPAPPNNVLAPFWTDIDMDGSDPNDSGAGIWYAANLTSGPDSYIVLEWEDVELANTSGLTYTFQIWIEQDTSNIWFVYERLPTLPPALTVGAENASGTIGTVYYANGSGTAPMTGTELLVTSAPGGSATFTYTVRANDALFDYEARNVAEAVDGTSTYTASASSTVRTPLRAGFASNTPVELGSEAVFTSTTTGSMPISYTWDLGDGTVVSSTARLTHTYAATGTYTVLLMATNQFETDVVSGTYEVLAPPELLQYALPLVIKPADAIITGRAANERRETRYHTRE
jgi:uncharacterized repeat protein (TIGR01451 family)